MFACGIPIFFQVNFPAPWSVLSPHLILLQEVAAGQYLGTGGCTMVGQLVPILQVRQSSSQTRKQHRMSVRCQYYYKQSDREMNSHLKGKSLGWIFIHIYSYYKQTSIVMVLLFLVNFIFGKMKALKTVWYSSPNLSHNSFTPLIGFTQGVGYATMTIVFWLDIYYCIIIAWTLFYLISTFLSLPDLPWRHCGEN